MCSNHVPGLKIGPTHGVTCLTLSYLGKKIFFVSNHKLKNLDIWYVAMSSGPLQIVFKSYPYGQNLPHPGGQMFYIELCLMFVQIVKNLF